MKRPDQAHHISGVLAAAPVIATVAVMAGLITNIRTRASNASQTTFFLTMVMGSALYMAVQYLRYIRCTYLMNKDSSRRTGRIKGPRKRQPALIQVFEPSSSINADFFRMSAIFANHRRTRESIEHHLRKMETLSDDSTSNDGTFVNNSASGSFLDSFDESNSHTAYLEGPTLPGCAENGSLSCNSLFIENYIRELHSDLPYSPSLASEDDFALEYSDSSAPTSPECSIENKFDEISKSAFSSSTLQLSPRKLSSSHLKSPSSTPSKKTSWSLKSLLSGFVSPTQPSSRVQNSEFDDLRPLKLAMKEHRKFSWSK